MQKQIGPEHAFCWHSQCAVDGGDCCVFLLSHGLTFSIHRVPAVPVAGESACLLMVVSAMQGELVVGHVDMSAKLMRAAQLVEVSALLVVVA